MRICSFDSASPWPMTPRHLRPGLAPMRFPRSKLLGWKWPWNNSQVIPFLIWELNKRLCAPTGVCLRVAPEFLQNDHLAPHASDLFIFCSHWCSRHIFTAPHECFLELKAISALRLIAWFNGRADALHDRGGRCVGSRCGGLGRFWHHTHFVARECFHWVSATLVLLTFKLHFLVKDRIH